MKITERKKRLHQGHLYMLEEEEPKAGSDAQKPAPKGPKEEEIKARDIFRGVSKKSRSRKLF
jgi:hypothetical protein